MSQSIVIVGMGQLGQLFAEGFSRAGFHVIEVLRGQGLSSIRPDSVKLVLLAVGEESVFTLLAELPEVYLDRLVLLQNELRPGVWQTRYANQVELKAPTVASIWFEKKGDREAHVVLPSVLFGPQTSALALALQTLDLPYRTIDKISELHHELSLKNLYILGLNFSGLLGKKTAGELLGNEDFEALIDELILLEQTSLERSSLATRLGANRLKTELSHAILADPNHGCAGRTAAVRLARTLVFAQEMEVDLTICNRIASTLN